MAKGQGMWEDRDFSLGIDYECRLSRIVGTGAVVDWVIVGTEI